MIAGVLLLAGCVSNHSALYPAGPLAADILGLWWFYVAITTAVYLIVIGFLVWALARRRRGAEVSERRTHLVIGSAIGLSVLILFAFGIGDFVAGRPLEKRPANALRVHVTGNQFWWEIEYKDANPSQPLITANELHVPVGRPVELVLTSRDVIHSFWTPNLQGKKDLIPGHFTRQLLIADRPGRYEGQCTEYCGYQHANMRLVVHAESTERFDAWQAGQLAPAREPTSDEELRGRDVFLRSSCAACHTIRGTEARGKVGPDLTHVASRSTIAAGILPMTRGHLGGWVLDPQQIKPGSRMPATSLAGDELTALLAYLESLE